MGFDSTTVLLCAAGLLVGGFTKGIAGLGLPMASIPLLTLAVDLTTAVVLLSIPTTLSNVVQAFQRGAFLPVLRRFWPLMLPFLPTVALGAKLLVSVDPRALYTVLGVAILAITVSMRALPGLRVGPRLERVLSPLVGVVAGLLGGASSLFGPPIMIYLLSLRLERDEYVATVSLLYLTGAALFTGSLIVLGVLGPRQAVWSSLSLIPVLVGMFIGQRIGERMDRRRFERTLDVLYLLTAFTFFYKAFS